MPRIAEAELEHRGLLTTRSNPDAGNRSHEYDAAGNACYTQDANQAAAGQVLFTSYDFAGRPPHSSCSRVIRGAFGSWSSRDWR